MAEFKEVIRQNNEKGGPKPKKGTKNQSLSFNDPLYAVKLAEAEPLQGQVPEVPAPEVPVPEVH